MRVLAIDLGDKRTGLAVGDRASGIVTPAGVLEVPLTLRDGQALLDALARAADEHLPPQAGGAPTLVVGLPLNMDGSEGPRARLVRAFALRVAERTGRGVDFQDERLTTRDADWAMARSGLTRQQKKSRRDALAAAALLRDYLARPPGATGETGHAD